MKKYLFIFMFIISTFASNLEIEWQKSLGGVSEDKAYSVIETDDNNFLVTGWTSSSGAGGSDIWIVKLNTNGGVVWEKTLGGLKDDKAYSTIKTSDGGFAIAGTTSSQGFGYDDYWVIKIDSEANVVWNKTFGEFRTDTARSIIQTSDGGFVITGFSEIGSAYSQVWILKLDSGGNLVWSKDFGGNAEEDSFKIIQTKDGGYAFAGVTTSKSSNCWIVKLDTNASIEWEKNFGNNSGDRINSIQQNSDGSFILGGWKYSNNNSDAWVIKIDSNASLKWEKSFGGSGDDGVYSIIKKDDGFLFGGFKSDGGDKNFWVMELDTNGTKKWEQSFINKGEDLALSTLKLSNDKLILVGSTYENKDYNALIMKLNHKPMITEFSIDNSTPLSNTIITLSTTATDINKDELSYFYNYGDEINVTTDNTHSYVKDGNYTIVVMVDDGHRGISESNLSIRVGEPICLEGEKLENHKCITKTCRSDKYNCPLCIGEQTLKYYDENGSGYCEDPICVEYEFLEDGICVYVVNQIPSLDLIVSKSIVEVGENVEFLALANDVDGFISRYFWDFGDGTNSTKVSPTHKYTFVGNYKVGCLISDDRDSNIIKYLDIKVEPSTNPNLNNNPNDINDSSVNNLIILSISVNTTKGQAPLRVEFSPNVDGNKSSTLSYSWDFGDGTKSSDIYPVHTYNTIGNYVVKLSALDGNSVATEAMKIIEVTQTTRINLSETLVQVVYFDKDSSELSRTIEVYNGVAPFSWSAENGDFKFKDYNKRIAIYLPPDESGDDLITIEDNSNPKKKAFVEVKYLGLIDDNSTKNAESNATTLSIVKGWNLISLPVKVNLSSNSNRAINTENINKLGDFEKIFIFNEKWETYSKSDNNPNFKINYGDGFWIKSNQQNSIEFKGDSYTPNFSNLTESRWYLLGTGKSLTNIKDTLNFSVVWSYKNSTWSENPQTIRAGDGFWVKKP